MITCKTGAPETITYNDSYRHKYDSAIAEYIDLCGWSDASTGDVDSFGAHVALVGKRLVFTDDRGFVSCDRYPSKRMAEQVFDAIDYSYLRATDEDEEMSDSAAADINRWIAEVVTDSQNGETSQTFHYWLNNYWK